MTTDQPSPSLPTVQTRKRGGKLKPKACPPRRITYRSILKELKGKPKGKSICDIAVEGLRWRRSDNKGSIVAEYRYADPVTGKQRGKTLGRLPSEAQLEALHGSSDQAAFWLNCDAPVERFRAEARRLAALQLLGHDPASRIGPRGDDHAAGVRKPQTGDAQQGRKLAEHCRV